MLQTDPKMKSSASDAQLGKALKEHEGNQALEPTDIIRTETVLSKLPIHQLAKRGSVPIRIVQKRPDGTRVELHWEVRPNPITGEPRALGYKVDTLIVNRILDQLGSNFPRLVRIGSLSSIAKELGLGRKTALVKRILEQNAHTIIIAKLGYKTADRGEREFEAQNTRYALYFWRSTLPDGTKSDSVYLSFNDPFYQLLREAPRRPLDYEYLKALPPAAQRFYELVSFQIFSAIRNGLPHAALRYSEYCTFGAQARFYNRSDMQAQMARVHRPHKKSGYLASVAYDPIKDDEGKPDWLLRYQPGPKAWAEYQTFNRRKGKPTSAAPEPEAGEISPPATPTPATQLHPVPVVDEELLKALTDCGMYQPVARTVLAGLTTIEQLERLNDCIDYWRTVPGERGPGLLHHLITSGEPLPATFQTRRQRREREEAKKARDAAATRQMQLEQAYEDYRRTAVDAGIIRIHTTEAWEAILAAKEQDLVTTNPVLYGRWTKESLRSAATRTARTEIARELSLMDFKAFCEQQGTTAQPSEQS
jgi:hypothetical protein